MQDKIDAGGIPVDVRLVSVLVSIDPGFVIFVVVPEEMPETGHYMADQEDGGKDGQELEVAFLGGNCLLELVKVAVPFLLRFEVLEKSCDFEL